MMYDYKLHLVIRPHGLACGSSQESMSNNKPMDADFKEYQNTGDGAISEAVSGMSFLTETEYQALETFLSSAFDFVTTYLGSNN